MKTKTIIGSIIFTFMLGLNFINAQSSSITGLNIVFEESSFKFTEPEKDLITKTIVLSEKEIRILLPELPKNIKIFLEIMDRDLYAVGGTTGRAQKHEPDGEVYVYISNLYPNGIEGAVKASLAYTIHHEFHHLVRGWTMIGNKFGQGIDIAMVNEGLAVVFAENSTKQIFEGNSFPKEAVNWVDEILALPKNANYNDWMNQHPDGRMGVGYRSGNFVIRKAMKDSGKNILEMSKLDPQEILELAGY